MVKKERPSNRQFGAVWKYVKTGDFVIFLIGLIIGFVLVHIAYFPAAGRIGELEGQVNNLQGEILGVQSLLGDRETQIDELQAEVQNKTAQIVELQYAIATSDLEISGLEAEVVEKENTIASLQSQNDSLNRQITAKDNQILSLQQDIEDLESEIALLGERPEVLGVYFSPFGDCEAEIRQLIGNARSSIHILMYSFTLDSLGNALVDAYNRGVEVRVVFEESWTIGVSQDDKLRAAGISVRTDTNTRNMNNKVMIIDGEIVTTGSYDWSQTAETFNNENLIVIKSTDIGAIYEEEFSKIWGQSRA